MDRAHHYLVPQLSQPHIELTTLFLMKCSQVDKQKIMVTPRFPRYGSYMAMF